MAGDYVEIKTPSYNPHFVHWRFESKPTIFCAIAESGIDLKKNRNLR
jgi:hypothetical protein